MSEAPKPMSIDFTTIGIVTVLAIGALVFLFFRPQDSADTRTYEGFVFTNFDGIWTTEWQRGGQIYFLDFRHTPDEVIHIPVSGETDIRFQLEQVYITIDPQEERMAGTSYLALAATELTRKLVTPFERNVSAACTINETDACVGRPIITCDNTNSSVVYLKHSEQTRIVLDGNCVTFEGSGEDLVMAVDKALFQWLGIIG
jgi:hypothetical protein